MNIEKVPIIYRNNTWCRPLRPWISVVFISLVQHAAKDKILCIGPKSKLRCFLKHYYTLKTAPRLDSLVYGSSGVRPTYIASLFR